MLPRRINDRLRIQVMFNPLGEALIVTNDSRIPTRQVTADLLNYGRSGTTDEIIRMYAREIVHAGFATKEEIDIEISQSPYGKIHLPAQLKSPWGEPIASQPPLNQSAALSPSSSLNEFHRRFLMGTWDTAPPTKLPAPPPPEPELEVNMMECLVGWKGWNLAQVDELLHSPSYKQDVPWPPDAPYEATCDNCSQPPAKKVVFERHTCGIYATDEAKGVKSYGTIRGQVYGWGRYVRGDKGWRAQFAYPKSFHLTSDQAQYIESLKKYHVDIFIDDPVKIYNAEEEGYSIGYGNTEEDGDSGAAHDSGAEETRSPDADSTAY